MKDTHRYVSRIVIEFTTPFHIGAGWEGEISDAEVAVDVNGLPALPGTSIAGALRALFESEKGLDAAENIFGYQKKDKGRGSRLRVSWGALHDSNDKPVEGLLDESEISDDTVLMNAKRPTLRDHVLINHKGVSDAEKHGKFDELAVCAGHRFTFELELIGNQEDKKTWEELTSMISRAEMRLGGKTRRGFGSFKVVRMDAKAFDLGNQGTDFEAYLDHPVSLRQDTSSLEPKTFNENRDASVYAELKLVPRGYWMFGGGDDLEMGEADMAPVRDSKIVWNDLGGEVMEDLLYLPGSSIKGALSHRTAFHYNLINGIFADKIKPGEFDKHTGYKNQAVSELFGYPKGDDENSKEDGKRGIIMIDDVFLNKSDPPSQRLHHVSINRFTGGAMDGALFSERPLWKGDPVTIRITVDSENGKKVEKDSRQALKKAIHDLADGKLQLGGGSGRGHGYFESAEGIKWSDDEKWIEGGPSDE